MREVKNRFQHLNSNCIEADWMVSLYFANNATIASIYKPHLRHLMMVQYDTCSVQSSAGVDV
jgi:hypothetical protein